MHIHFRDTENQRRWAWTNGLRTLKQQEIAVMVFWPEHDPRNELLIHLFQFFENYLSSQPKRILAGQTIHYGWTTLRFVSDEHNLSGIGTDVLLIEELQHPFSQGQPFYVPGVACALALLQLQEEVMRRNRMTGEAIHPHRSQFALACTRVTPETIPHLRPLMAHRAYQPDAQDSGWFFGCCDQNHDHDNPDKLATIHLHHLVEHFPGLFPYLGMPMNTMLVFEKNQTIIFHPGEQEGQLDPDSLLATLPCLKSL